MRTIVLALVLVFTVPALARDDGRYANSPLKALFESLRSQKGYCCAEADGRETEYEMPENSYWVPINGVWTEVPQEALITEPNRVGRPMLWLDQLDRIRCFIPGSGT